VSDPIQVALLTTVLCQLDHLEVVAPQVWGSCVYTRGLLEWVSTLDRGQLVEVSHRYDVDVGKGGALKREVSDFTETRVHKLKRLV
jgi:hypothetical protein